MAAMNMNCLLLAESLPPRVLSSLRDLPKRLLFSNEHLQMVLAGLHAGQVLERFEAPVALVVVVAFGTVELRVDRSRSLHREGGDFRLEPGTECDLAALGEADLLFFIPTERASPGLRSLAVEAVRPTNRRQQRASCRERDASFLVQPQAKK